MEEAVCIRLKIRLRQLIASGQRAIWILLRNAFEIGQKRKRRGGIFTLYHKESPIGTALTEFLYADLKVFPAHLGNIKTCLKEIRAGNDVDTRVPSTV